MSDSPALGNFFFVPGPDYSCPTMPFDCIPPAACARDPTTGRTFCCDPNSVCFAGGTTCASDDSTFQCGTDGWCCASGAETCTGSSGQINVCWSKRHDVLFDVGAVVLNKTYSSLSAANPDATAWAFNPQSLIAATDTTSQLSTSTTTSTTSNTSSNTLSSTDSSTSTTATTAVPTTTAADAATADSSQAPSPPTDASSSNSLSSGAIAGIVIGAVGALALVALAVLFFRRRRHSNQEGIPWAAVPQQSGPSHELPTGHLYPSHELPTGYQGPKHELSSGQPMVELPGSQKHHYR